MLLPPWAIFAIAAWLFLFGSYRIVVGLRGRRRAGEREPKQGIFALSWRRHVVFGVFYLVVGAYLVAMGFGYGIPGPSGAEEPVPLPPERSEHLILDSGGN